MLFFVEILSFHSQLHLITERLSLAFVIWFQSLYQYCRRYGWNFKRFRKIFHTVCCGILNCLLDFYGVLTRSTFASLTGGRPVDFRLRMHPLVLKLAYHLRILGPLGGGTPNVCLKLCCTGMCENPAHIIPSVFVRGNFSVISSPSNENKKKKNDKITIT